MAESSSVTREMIDAAAAAIANARAGRRGSPMHPTARGRSRIPDHARPVLWKDRKLGGGSAA